MRSGEGKRSMKKIAILQSNYIPWKGNFDMMAAADVFIIYADMQLHPSRLAESQPDQHAAGGGGG